MTEEIKLSVLVSLFTWIQRSRPSAKKRSKFRKFLDTFCKPSDYFSAMRLILPSLDRERGTYGLKESVLAICLIDALGLSRDSADALRLVNWRKGGANTGANAGNFALVAAEILQRRQGTVSGGLTIKELNELLDRLASAESRAEKTAIFATLINKTNAQEMKWVIMIILKDLKLGITEKSIFQEFHPDAEDLFNVTCDLKLVCEKLRDPTQRHKRQDIEVGKAVRPQLALRVRDPAAAWKKLHGKEVVVECKFDGDRIQIHKNGTDIHYYSRLGNLMEKMLSWGSLNQFAEFGSNQEIAKAAKDGLDSDRQVLCFMLYPFMHNLKQVADVAFDILYVGDTSVIHQSLKERHEILQKVVKPLKGRLEILVPNGGLNANRPPVFTYEKSSNDFYPNLAGEPCWSCIAHSVNDVERFFKETIENRDEGIVIKDLNSKWEPGDRNGKWLKLKPDYIRAGSDLDVLIIGGYYGSGRRGGEVAQFLVGLADRPDPNAYPRRFSKSIRIMSLRGHHDVGTGLTDDDLETVAKKLKPYFRKYEYPKKMQPSFYQVKNHSKERPDVWIESPESIILSITSDIRTIRSEVFAAPYSLRFPRIDRVRYDKPWHECLDVQSFVELVHSSNGTTQKGTEQENQPDSKTKHKAHARKADRKNVSIVPSHFIRTDTSCVKGETLIFSNLMFCILQYFLFLSESSKTKLQQEVDQYFDPYYWDLELADIKQLLNNIQRSENSKTIDYYRAKYCPNDKWSLFHGCSVYFYSSAESLKADWQVLLNLALRRLKLEILMGGGKISENLSHATHLVVLSVPGLDVDFDSLIKSCSFEEKNLVWKKGLHVVKSQWLENCIERGQKLREDQYSLKPNDFEETNFVESKLDQNLEKSKPDFNGVQNKGTSTSPESKTKQRGGKDHPKKSISAVTPSHGNRKRRPASKNTKKGKTIVTRAQRVPRRRGKMSVKIDEDGSEESGSDDKTNEEIGKGEGNNTECYRRAGRENFEFHQNQAAEENVGINWPKKAHDTVMCEANNDQPGNKAEKFDHMELDEGKYGHEISTSEKLEVMVDPVQAMLLDMIPSLGIKHVETTNSVVQNEKPHMDNDADIRVVEDEKLDADFIPQPQKKKKPKQSLKSSTKHHDEDRNGGGGGEVAVRVPKPSLPHPQNSSNLFSHLPQPKPQQPPNPPVAKRIVQFKPPINPNTHVDSDDDEEEEKERPKRGESETLAQGPSVKSFLSSIPAPRNSTTLGVAPSSGSGRRSIIDTQVIPTLTSSTFEDKKEASIDNNAPNYSNYEWGSDVNAGTTVGYNNYVNYDQSSVDQNSGNYGNNDQNIGSYANYADYSSYQSSSDPNIGGVDAATSYGSYESYGNYHVQYENNWGDGSTTASMLPETTGIADFGVKIKGKRGRNDLPVEIVEVKQDDLTKNRPREDQVKMTGIAFGPSYQPASSKGKPTKLHKRKHQIGSLYFDMKQKEMELQERRSRGLLTKAETQAKYGW
ncbi:hypothetical protein GOBAR_AA16074 [Gossypium barbadense]|uniref:DNA ligase n=1 Tax=Gossypium barbadense TaxID=3634 RepID=A0A2P5XMN9_GOSBA|nr:hypothetical protein GOBAR_AA16074 [Gossypium barbadense]